MIREAKVAGEFYPANKEELENQIKELFKKVKARKFEFEEIIAIVSPHAGYMYSGIVQAYSYYYLKFSKVKRFVIVGLDHYGIGFEISIFKKGYWETPLGKVEIDEELANEILKEIKLEENEKNFEYEHSIEVQLPFLQYLFKDFTFVPIMISNQKLENAKSIANALRKVYEREKFVLITTSDLNHYEDYETTKAKDKLVIDAIKKLDSLELYSRILKYNISACGYACLATFIEFSKLLNAKVKFLKYMNSCDVTKDFSYCVGYVSFLSYK